MPIGAKQLRVRAAAEASAPTGAAQASHAVQSTGPEAFSISSPSSHIDAELKPSKTLSLATAAAACFHNILLKNAVSKADSDVSNFKSKILVAALLSISSGAHSDTLSLFCDNRRLYSHFQCGASQVGAAQNRLRKELQRFRGSVSDLAYERLFWTTICLHCRRNFAGVNEHWRAFDVIMYKRTLQLRT
jgi:hypothetical protein